MAKRSAHALIEMTANKITTRDILTEDSLHNALVVHAAFGGSTNLLLHIPAIAHAAKLPRPTVEDWSRANRSTPRLVDVIPNGPTGYGTVQVFLAGGVPEVMLHLRGLGLLKLNAYTVNGNHLGEALEKWEHSERRERLRARLQELDGVDPDDVILSPTQALERGFTGTITFLTGNLAPQGAVIKSTAIDSSVVDSDGVYRKTSPARVFTSERAAIAAVKGLSENPVKAGDIIALIGCGPMGTGMEETYQLTSA
jgi:dihydroxyacid dehydratase/phosphogluconate dehydratase